MKISFDIDGVMTVYPKELSTFMAIVKTSGHEVVLATGRAENEVKGSFPKEFLDNLDFLITCDGPEEELKYSDKPARSDMQKVYNWKVPRLNEEGVQIHYDDYADVMMTHPDIKFLAVRIRQPGL